MTFGRKGIDRVSGIPLDERIGVRCTIVRDQLKEVPISRLRPCWWRDAAQGPRAWVRATRAWCEGEER